MESVNLLSAFRAARRDTFYQNGRAIRPGPAVRAVALARDNLARVGVARLAYDTARAAVAELKADALGAPRAAESVHMAAALAAEKTALRTLTAAESLAGRYASPVWGGGDYGAGTWQGGNPDAAPSALPFYLPPAMRGTARQHGAGGSARSQHARPDSDSPAFGSPRRDPGGRFYWHAGGGRDVLRNVRDAGDVWRGASEWLCDPYGESFRDGTGLVVGVVGQLRGRDGRAVYVAGWRFKGHDDNGTFDLRTLYTAEGREESDAEEAAEAAAREADSLAEKAAEAEREYQAAHGAGAAWAEAGEELAAAREGARSLLAERRAQRKAGNVESPAICRAIRDSVAGFLADMSKARARRAELADGSAEYLWHDGGRDARAAFCEGAGLELARAPF